MESSNGHRAVVLIWLLVMEYAQYSLYASGSSPWREIVIDLKIRAIAWNLEPNGFEKTGEARLRILDEARNRRVVAVSWSSMAMVTSPSV